MTRWSIAYGDWLSPDGLVEHLSWHNAASMLRRARRVEYDRYSSATGEGALAVGLS